MTSMTASAARLARAIAIVQAGSVCLPGTAAQTTETTPPDRAVESRLITRQASQPRPAMLESPGALWLVPAGPDQRERIASFGVEVVQAVPGFGFVVRGERSVLPDAVFAGVTPFTAADRFAPGLAAWLTATAAIRGVDVSRALTAADRTRLDRAAGAHRFTLFLTARTTADDPLIDRVAELGGWAINPQVGARFLDIHIGPGGLIQLVTEPGVLYAERWAPPQNDDPLVRNSTGANYIESVAGYTGTGVVGSVMDNGLLTGHQEFVSLPPPIGLGNTEQTWHGTPVYGALFGDGAGQPNARGVLPDAVGWFSSYFWLTNRDTHFASLVSPDVGAVFESNSWGTTRTRRYTTRSAELDDLVFRYDLLVTQSQSNTGTPDSRPEAWAKNVVSVGGVNAYGTTDTADDAWAASASTGPAYDGRIKPDLVHFYDGILTTADTDLDEYRIFTGTSASTPVVAGHFGLFFQMWADGVFGNPTFATGVFNNRCSSSLARAFLINTARPYAFAATGDDLGRFRQGWGLPDLRRLYDRRDETAYWEVDAPISDGAGRVHAVQVQPGTPELRITMVYPDPAGLPQAVSPVLNDLDLRVEAPDGTVYWGNAGLLDGVWSLPGGEPDARNTVENVFIQSPQPGRWRAEVIARSLVEDGYLGTGEIDAVFALVASGATRVNPLTAIRFAEPLPTTLDPWTEFEVILEQAEPDPVWTGELQIAVDGQQIFVPLVRGSDQRLSATIPPMPCGTDAHVAVRLINGQGQAARLPADGGTYPLAVRSTYVALDERFGTPSYWSASFEDPVTGGWEWGSPSGGGLRYDPVEDADGNGTCWVTENGSGLTDVTGGPARLTSPPIEVPAGTSPVLEYAAYLACDDAGLRPDEEDTLSTEISTDDGQTWQQVDEMTSTFVWRTRRVDLGAAIGDAARFRVRFVVSDVGRDSVTEAAIDHVRVTSRWCSPCVADLDANGSFNVDDVFAFLAAFVDGEAAADCDGVPGLNVDDVLCYLAAANAGCE